MSDILITLTRDIARLGLDFDVTDTRRHGMGAKHKLGQNAGKNDETIDKWKLK